MFRVFIRAGLMAGATGIISCVATTGAAAHGFAGARFFPATIATDDPFVADELALPTVVAAKDSNDVKTITYAADFAKRITSNFALEIGATYVQLRPPGGPDIDGFDNLSLGAKYLLDIDPLHETIF